MSGSQCLIGGHGLTEERLRGELDDEVNRRAESAQDG